MNMFRISLSCKNCSAISLQEIQTFLAKSTFSIGSIMDGYIHQVASKAVILKCFKAANRIV